MQGKHLLLSLVITAIVFAPAVAFAGSPGDEVARLHQRYITAVREGDMKFLDALFADTMITTGNNGRVRGKKEELDDLRPLPDFKLGYFRTEDLRVMAYGDTVVVTGLLEWQLQSKEKSVDFVRRYTYTYAKIKGRWQIVAQHLSQAPMVGKN